MSFTLPESAPARLEVVDVAGRVMEAREVGGMGAGRHTVQMASAGRLPAGINFITLTQGTRRLVSRVAVVR